MLKGVSFTVSRGEVVAIVGKVARGRARCCISLGRWTGPTEGVSASRAETYSAKGMPCWQHSGNASIGFVFQFHHLLPEFTALENVAMPALIGGAGMAAARERAQELLNQLGLSDRAQHRPSELSGGEQQRVAVARALVNGPGLVLADEPTGNLDARTADTLHREILRLSRTVGQTFIVVTHNPSLASLCDRVLRLEDGLIHL